MRAAGREASGLGAPSLRLVAVALLAAAAVGPTRRARAGDDVDALRTAALASIARARAARGSEVVREVTLPSIERLVEDADLRRASVTKPARDNAFVTDTLATAKAYAERVAKGDDPYQTVTGEVVKAYRASSDGTLQPYALYVPRGYDGRSKDRKGDAWPLIVALHGAFSDHKHNLRRVFGLDNRPGETDAEASRNRLPLPDVPAFVVSPLGRGELMGFDGLGYDDVMRVIADVRRAYKIDPDRITLTGLSMGGGATWAIGLRHPELFAALAPVCAVANFARMVQPADAALYDLARLAALSPPAIAENAAHLQVFIFHGDKDPTVPVEDSRKMVARFEALGWLGKNVHYTEYPGVAHPAWVPAYRDAQLLRALAAHQARSGRAQDAALAAAARRGDPGARRQERPTPAPAPLRLRHQRSARGGGGREDAGRRARRLGPDGRGQVPREDRPRGDRRRSRALQPGVGRRGAVQQAGGRGGGADARRAPARRSRLPGGRPRRPRPRQVRAGAGRGDAEGFRAPATVRPQEPRRLGAREQPFVCDVRQIARKQVSRRFF